MKGPHGGYYRKPLRPGARKIDRHNDAAFSDQEKFDFFNGVWVGLRSEWLTFATYDAIEERLKVTFKDGYRGQIWADESLAESFTNAISKGGFWWDRVISEGRTVEDL